MSLNPLVAPSADTTTWHTGLAGDAAAIAGGIRDNSWVDPLIGGAGASLDMLSLAVDPLGTLFSWGVSWLLEHVRPLKESLDWLAGNADAVAAHAGTWSNVAAFTEQAGREYGDRLRAEVSGWTGAAGDAYREQAAGHLEVLGGLAAASRGVSSAVEGAGLLVALVRGLVRDLVAEFVGTLAARLPQWLAMEGLTLGLASPAVIGQVSALVFEWVNRIQRFVRALLGSLRRLGLALDRLAARFTRGDALARGGPVLGPSEFRADFPRGSDFIDDGNAISERAAAAYRRIRHSPQDTSRVAANTGLDSGVVEVMRQNLFVQQHDVPLGPNRVERGYFTPDDDIVDLWEGAAGGTLTPEKTAEFRSLAAHEYVENKLMEAGLPYRSAHPDAFDTDGDRIINRNHPGAHDLAPNEWRPDAPLRHWRAFGIDSSGITMAGDLSNLDDVVEAALRGLRR